LSKEREKKSREKKGGGVLRKKNTLSDTESLSEKKSLGRLKSQNGDKEKVGWDSAAGNDYKNSVAVGGEQKREGEEIIQLKDNSEIFGGE